VLRALPAQEEGVECVAMEATWMRVWNPFFRRPHAEVFQPRCSAPSDEKKGRDKGAKGKLEYLEGLRGCACCVVLICHYLLAFTTDIVFRPGPILTLNERSITTMHVAFNSPMSLNDGGSGLPPGYWVYPSPFDYSKCSLGLGASPLSFVWNGYFAVAVFYALSGRVLVAK
jgi:peptidoglycan/LPS O-acetylase OafA/YrhL